MDSNLHDYKIEYSHKFSTKLHENVLDSFDGREKIYGKITNITEKDEQGTFQISISLVTRYMYQIDSLFVTNETEVDFNRDELETIRDGYHPYFLEFVATPSNDFIYTNTSEKIGEWMEIHLYPLRHYVEVANEVFIEGTVIFGASPLIRSAKKLVFSRESKADPYIAKLDSLYSGKDDITKNRLAFLTRKCVNDTNTLDAFKKVLPSTVNEIRTTVYNVGMGNNICLDLEGNKKVTVLFDVGCTYQDADIGNIEINNNLSSFHGVHMDAVILSHWDLDHILAVEYYQESDLFHKDMIWVAPDINLLPAQSLSASAFRISTFLAKRCKLYLSNNLSSNLGIGNSYFEIWQGDGVAHSKKGKKETTVNNVIGLLIQLTGFSKISVPMIHKVINHKSATIQALMCGDCTYKSIPQTIKDMGPYDLLLSPHHGTRYTTPDICSSGEGVAIISQGKYDGNTIFPDASHVKALQTCKYSDILCTEGLSKIDVILN